MTDRVIMTRLVKGRAPGREFDIAFWQKLGPTRIFEAAWDLAVTGYADGFGGPAWESRKTVDFGGVEAPVLSRHDLITAKLASGRPQDRKGARRLERGN